MIIALTGQKGGVGKSTTAICLAAHACSRGHRVLLVDADPQATSRTWGEVASERAGAKPLALPTVIAMGATMHRPGQLDVVARGYDWVVIDAPPRHGETMRSALIVADIAVLPCGPSAVDAWALASALEVVDEAVALRSASPEGRSLLACVLITRKQGRTALGKGARAVLGTSTLPVLRTELGYRIAYQEAIAAGLGVTQHAPRDPATREIQSLFSELIELFERTRSGHGKEEDPGHAAQTDAAE